MKITSLFIQLMLVVHISAISTIQLNYVLNKSYFANELCEQKAVINSCCKGKCFVNKMIRKVNNEEGTETDRKVTFKVTYEYLIGELTKLHTPKKSLRGISDGFIEEIYDFVLSKPIFDPPQA